MKRRSQAISLPLDCDYHTLLRRAVQPPVEPPPDPTTDLTELASELGKRLDARRTRPARATDPSSTTRPEPIPPKSRKYEHLSTPIQTLESMAAAGDEAAKVELDRIRQARERQQAATDPLETSDTAASPDPGGISP